MKTEKNTKGYTQTKPKHETTLPYCSFVCSSGTWLNKGMAAHQGKLKTKAKRGGGHERNGGGPRGIPTLGFIFDFASFPLPFVLVLPSPSLPRRRSCFC